MKNKIKKIARESLDAEKKFFDADENIESIGKVVSMLIRCVEDGGKVLVFGNGGSAADSQHMAAEFVVRFEKERAAFPCIALTTDTSILTAASNDYSFDDVFARQVEALAGPKDAVVAISTSGNSGNVINGALAAKGKKASVIALTGNGGGRLAEKADISVIVDEEMTARIQEIHVTVIHIICKMVEEALSL